MKRANMKSLIVKHSIILAGHKTSVSLEEDFWQSLKMIAALRNMPMSELAHQIDKERDYGNLSSAIRLFVLDYYLSRAKAKRDGQVAESNVSSPN